MKGYKGFDKDLKCRNFQYELGKIFKMEESPIICEKGFHFCEYPLDVFSYYSPVGNNRFCEIEALGEIDKDGDERDTKVATNQIIIGAELNFKSLTEASIEFIYERCKKDNKKSAHKEENRSVASNTENRSVASNTGYSSIAISTGNNSIASNTGYRSVASSTGFGSIAISTGDSSVASSTGFGSVAISTRFGSIASNTRFGSIASNTGDSSVAISTGDRSVASNTGFGSVAISTGDRSVASSTRFGSVAISTGDRSVASNTGKKGIASSLGIKSKAKGSLGTWLVLAEWVYDENEYSWEIKQVKTKKVDGKTIKADTLYQLINGKFVEVKEDE